LLFHLKPQVPLSDFIHFDAVRGISPLAILSAKSSLSQGTAIARASRRLIEFTAGVRQGGSSHFLTSSATATKEHTEATKRETTLNRFFIILTPF
jgi:hypothetical protein